MLKLLILLTGELKELLLLLKIKVNVVLVGHSQQQDQQKEHGFLKRAV